MQEHLDHQRDGRMAEIADRYDFHDPMFVNWWLSSLYLLPVETQLAAASSVKAVVHVPEVHAEVDLFMARFGSGPLAAGLQVEAASTQELEVDKAWVDVVVAALRRLWQERPAVIWLGIIVTTVLVIRGINALISVVT